MRKLVILAFILTCFSAFGKLNKSLPDVDGMTLKGIVYCNDKTVQGVKVSDGVNVTTTDQHGRYYLPSDKRTGHVFICNPVGYEPVCNGKYPQFYSSINTNSPDSVEQHNFELIKSASKDPAVIMIADLQLCGRFDDTTQFLKSVAPDINATIEKFHNQKRDVKLITLGDQGYNNYWSQNNIRILEVNDLMDNLNADAIYNCMGNHDNDEQFPDDWNASHLFRKECGPTYYSMNIGKMHYVVLDNIVYSLKDGKAKWSCGITPQILEWLKQDLNNMDKSTPLVLCMHAPLFKRPQCSADGIPSDPGFGYDFGKPLSELVKDFKNVTVFSGHTHINYREMMGNIIEYNVASACGSLWATGYYTPRLNICRDGSPAGYQVVENSGHDFKTYYKGIGYDKDFQFRCYDLNNCHITREKFAPTYTNKKNFDKWLIKSPMGYGNESYNEDGSPKYPNQILINVFAYDPRWKVEAFEGETPLEVKRISAFDPLPIIGDCCKRLECEGRSSGGMVAKVSHLFMATAKKADTPITIKVTDESGNIYTRVMNRPSEFSLNAYTPKYE